MVLCVEVGPDNVPFMLIGKHRLRLDLEELSEEYQNRAKEELRETPDVVRTALSELRIYISGDTNLHVPIDDEVFLMKFLRPFKFYPDSAFKMLKKFYKFRMKYPKYGLNVTPDSIKHVFDNEVFVMLPTTTPSGSRIMLINGGAKWNPKVVPVHDLFKAMMVTTEIAMMEPRTQVAGVQLIMNLEGLSLNHVCQFSPATAKILMDWIQECAPVRLKGIHIINQSVFFDMAFALFKPFIGEKLKKRLYLHGNNKNSLREKLSPEALPTYLGGTEKVEYPGHLFSEMLFYYEEAFKKLSSYGYKSEKNCK